MTDAYRNIASHDNDDLLRHASLDMFHNVCRHTAVNVCNERDCYDAILTTVHKGEEEGIADSSQKNMVPFMTTKTMSHIATRFVPLRSTTLSQNDCCRTHLSHFPKADRTAFHSFYMDILSPHQHVHRSYNNTGLRRNCSRPGNQPYLPADHQHDGEAERETG